jgi:hypothetical protein
MDGYSNDSIRICIGGIVISVEGKDAYVSLFKARRWKPYIYKGIKAPALQIKVTVSANSSKKIDGFPEGIRSVPAPEDQKKIPDIVTCDNDKITVSFHLRNNALFVWLNILPAGEPFVPESILVLRCLSTTLYSIIYYYLLTFEKGIFIHACGIKDKMGGGIFVGRSGAGKTTLVRFARSIAGFKCINDDRLIIRKQNGKFFIYNTPFHGDYLPEVTTRKINRVVLRRIFLIHKGLQVRIQALPRLSSFRYIFNEALSNSYFTPENQYEFLSRFCCELVKQLPVRRLFFARDYRFGRLLSRGVKGKVFFRDCNPAWGKAIGYVSTKKDFTLLKEATGGRLKPFDNMALWDSDLYVLSRAKAMIFRLSDNRIFPCALAGSAREFAFGDRFYYIYHLFDGYVYRYSFKGKLLGKFGMKRRKDRKKTIYPGGVDVRLAVASTGEVYVRYPEECVIARFSGDGKFMGSFAIAPTVSNMVLNLDTLYVLDGQCIKELSLSAGKELKKYPFVGFLETCQVNFLSLDENSTLFFDDRIDKVIYSFRLGDSEKFGAAQVRFSDLGENDIPAKCLFNGVYAYIFSDYTRTIRVYKKKRQS